MILIKPEYTVFWQKNNTIVDWLAYEPKYVLMVFDKIQIMNVVLFISWMAERDNKHEKI